MPAPVCITYPASTSPQFTPKPADAKKNLTQTLPSFNFEPINMGQWQAGSTLNSAPGTAAQPMNGAMQTLMRAIIAVLNNTGTALQKLIHNLAQWQQSINNTLLQLEGADFTEDRGLRVSNIVAFASPSGDTIIFEQIDQVVWVNGLGQQIVWMR